MEYNAYSRRWLLLSIVSWSVFILNHTSRSLAAANNIVVEYFQVTPSAIDTLAVICDLLSAPISILVGIIGSYLGLRKLMLVQTFFLFLGSTFSTLGFLSRNLFWMIMVGRALMGIPLAINNVLPIILAANWFPDGELATAFGIAFASNAVGGSFSGIILPYLFQNVEFPAQNMELPDQNLEFPAQNVEFPGAVNSISTLNNTDLMYIYDDRRVKFMAWSGATAFIMFSMLLLTILYCDDHPPTAPSAAQQNYRHIREATAKEPNQLRKETLSRLLDIKYLLMQKSFLLILLAISLKSVSYIIAVLVPSFLTKTGIVDEITAGWLVTVLYTCAVFGTVIAGRILDKFKSSKLIFLVCHCILILSCVWIYLGHKFLNIISLFFAYSLSSSCYYAAVTAVMELVVEITYPMDKAITISMVFAFHMASGFGFVSFCRWVEQITDQSWSVFVLIPVNCLALIAILFIKPEYKRTSVERTAMSEESESLLHK